MADKKFIKGLFKDTAHIDQPEGSWRYAKNTIINDKKGSVSNEGGNDLDTFLNSRGIGSGTIHYHHQVIGAIEVNDDQVVLFSVKIIANFDSQIGIWKKGTYTVLYDPDPVSQGHDLNFSINYPIEGTFKIDSKGDLIVYWTDDNNPPRAFNVNRQLRALAVSTAANPPTELYGINAGTANSKFHINLLNLFPHSGPVPHIKLNYVETFLGQSYPNNYQSSVIEGGGLRTGAYYLALAYVDDDLVATNFLTVSNPVSIVDEYDHTTPTTKKDGAREGHQTSKAIHWLISNINTDYDFIRPVIIRKMGDATEAFRLNDVEQSIASSKGINFSGAEGFTPTSVDDIIIDTVAYDTAKTINQLDGVLYVGNTTGTQDVGYQKYANNIKLNSVTKPLYNFDEFHATVDNLETGFGNQPVESGDPTQSYRYIPLITDYKGYMRDETYAFYIAFILNDGSMSYAYHIPGREKIEDVDWASVKYGVGYNWAGLISYSEDEPVLSTGAVNNNDLQELSRDYAKFFHFYDSSTFLAGANISVITGQRRHMNYWENATEFYPSTSDFEIWDSIGGGTQIGSLVNDGVFNTEEVRVRHHHFPSNENKYRKSIQKSNSWSEVSQGTSLPIGYSGRVAIFEDKNHQGLPFNFATGQGNAWNCCGSGQCSSTTNPLAWARTNYATTGNDHRPWFNNTQPSQTSPWGQFNADVNDPFLVAAVWDVTTQKFRAPQPMKVTVYYSVWHTCLHGTNSNCTPTDCGIRYVNNGGGATATGVYDPDTINTYGGAGYFWDCGNTRPIDFTSSPGSTPGWTVDMEQGDEIFITARAQDSSYDWHVRQYGIPVGGAMGSFAFTSGDTSGYNFLDPWGSGSGPVQYNDSVCVYNFVWFDIETVTSTYPIHDAHVTHEVDILGFELEDIKIPQSIADKVQGFKIYYAKRDHANRTVLGQDVAVPMVKKKARIGICSEAQAQGALAYQTLSTLKLVPEDFWNVDPWPTLPTVDYGDFYKTVSFHDFHLLRTHNSLSPATHVKRNYDVKNYVWNGMALDADMKMLTYLTEPPPATPNDPYVLREEWGHDPGGGSITGVNQNCYPRDVLGVMTIGHRYTSPVQGGTTPAMNFVLGQKAKSYVLGDSIFKAEALGFGGKLFNEFGESHIALRFKDNPNLDGLPRQTTRPEYAFASPVTGQDGGGINFSAYGVAHQDLGGAKDQYPAILINPNVGGSSADSRINYNHVNLMAFKSDLYKSIDNQELIWTGFEVLGTDLDNFVFDETGAPLPVTYANYTTGVGDYRTYTLQNDIQGLDKLKFGIFGGDTYICRYGWAAGLKPSNVEDFSNHLRGINYGIVESVDNINFRHYEDDKSMYFPGHTAKDVLDTIGKEDLSHIDNLKYNHNYSAVNDIRPAFPLPVKETRQDDFPTRTHRSAKSDTTSLIDNYRIFLANQFKDLPKHRGDLWKLSSFNNLLYFHMEETLYVAKGKQQMQMKDGSEAFIGSGDLFQQEPDELIHTEGGYAGTQSQYAAITTRNGYFFVDQRSKKVFLMTDKLSEISSIGMESWFRENLKFALEDFGLSCNFDNPIRGIGLHAIWDPKYKRILLTKRDLSPTSRFLTAYNLQGGNYCNGNLVGELRFNTNRCLFQIWIEDDCASAPCPCYWYDLEWDNSLYFTRSGWTISYYPELGIWVSFHDYVPYLYFNTSINFYSFTDQHPRPPTATVDGTNHGSSGIWEHNTDRKGVLYQEEYGSGTLLELGVINFYPFEFEFIHNDIKDTDNLYASIGYTLETFNSTGISVLEHGFTHFFLYNTLQISGIGSHWQLITGGAQEDFSGITLTTANTNTLEYLVNVRRKGNHWKIHSFRDMAALATDTSAYYMSTNTNVIGGINTGTVTTSSITNMFLTSGMHEIPNAFYIDLSKTWDNQRKFIDKWLGIRLIYDNITNNLLNLYSTNVEARKFYR